MSSPADTANLRIETVGIDGLPSGTLVHPNAYKAITPTGSMVDMEVELTGLVD